MFSPTITETELKTHYQEIHSRLTSPPQPHKDLPIELSHPAGITGWEAAKAAQERASEARQRQIYDAVTKIKSSPQWEGVRTWPPKFINRIKKIVCKAFDKSINEIDSPRRTLDVVIPRHVAMYLSRELTTKSYPEISRNFGDRDHSTTIVACRKMERRMRNSKALCQVVQELHDHLEHEIFLWRTKAMSRISEQLDPVFDGETYDHNRDQARLAGQLERVFRNMEDGQWRSLETLAMLVGGTEAAVSARLRDLRKEKFGSHRIERKHIRNGLWLYRLCVTKDNDTIFGV